MIFKLLFNMFQLFPQRKKATFVASFGDNIFYVADEIAKIQQDEIIILKHPKCNIEFENIKNSKIYSFECLNLFHLIVSIYHLSTSKIVFTDNYYGFLSVTNFKPNVKCVQLWHAAGAIKKFGLMDPSIKGRQSSAKKRIQSVYQRHTHIAVGSEKMASIVRQSFGVDDKAILRTGVPRTDFFYDENKKQSAIEQLRNEFPIIKSKKVILYAPTFRDGEFNLPDIQLDLQSMYEELKDDFVVFLRIHPAVNFKLNHNYSNFVYDVSDYYSVNHLLLITDYLITDYSSIPFECSLLKKPMIFFMFDLNDYRKKPGIWKEFESNIPGPIAKNTREILSIIKNNHFNYLLIEKFADEWNQYSKGNSSESLIKGLYYNIE
ncbi:CDP-glycerol glycerophosphotransferase family protein [Pseudalkalibacillus salsuginis]|uniref:CDP-glycerol glycerophosphotransferase family protein n=1 Tax=Pseudalkalibacillus salsuginis TaxID=2910972 RepID=UPI001F1EB9AF|nr:CDP-glycerol glycerophosphotransferase family protein [Pseudalkalibacillus salsuginis]MCF6410117.1 CDP-glycerol glycerophosphotransferase family protein [Pseudalkalibacillus salsuginis]